ncbi:glycosyltransferase [Gemella morbillorum]
MKVVQINTFPYKSTGHIMMNIHRVLAEQGHDSYVCWGRGRVSENEHEIVINDNLGVEFHALYTRIFDKTGFASSRATKILLQKLDEIKPDIIHLHNVHGYYINIEMLFNYIRKHDIKVAWTLHDCWSMTGHCACFEMCGCEKWKSGCFKCEQTNTYPSSKILDNSKSNWEKKRALFTGLNIIIITPSEWLKNIVQQSYLKEYPCVVINNGIDLNIFGEISKKRIKEVKEKYDLDDRKIILGVASEWLPRKGLNDFFKLSEMMKDVQFVLVGLTEKQLKKLPQNIRGIKRTENQEELVALYTIADIFFNPTYEDNFPTTNLEALACGTPVLTYDTGGSPEVLEKNDYLQNPLIGDVIKKISPQKVSYEIVKTRLYRLLEKTIEAGSESSIACKKISLQYEAKRQFEKYINVYNQLIDDDKMR